MPVLWSAGSLSRPYGIVKMPARKDGREEAPWLAQKRKNRGDLYRPFFFFFFLTDEKGGRESVTSPWPHFTLSQLVSFSSTISPTTVFGDSHMHRVMIAGHVLILQTPRLKRSYDASGRGN